MQKTKAFALLKNITNPQQNKRPFSWLEHLTVNQRVLGSFRYFKRLFTAM
jgi:hypothetical protein